MNNVNWNSEVTDFQVLSSFKQDASMTQHNPPFKHSLFAKMVAHEIPTSFIIPLIMDLGLQYYTTSS